MFHNNGAWPGRQRGSPMLGIWITLILTWHLVEPDTDLAFLGTGLVMGMVAAKLGQRCHWKFLLVEKGVCARGSGHPRQFLHI